MLSVEELFCSVDDFCQVFEHQWQCQLLKHDLQVRKRKRSLYLATVAKLLWIVLSRFLRRETRHKKRRWYFVLDRSLLVISI
jgi:hypothetical protein